MSYMQIEVPEEFQITDLNDRMMCREMKPKEVREFFSWYIGQKETRLKILEEYIRETGNSDVIFDYTPESLIPLWRWYEAEITVRRKTDEEIAAEREFLIKAFYPHDGSEIEISLETLTERTASLIVDISFYFAEVIIRNNPSIYWGYFTKPKNRDSVKSPVLLGFKYDNDLNPRTIVKVCTWHSLDKKNEKQLYDTYNVWLEDI